MWGRFPSGICIAVLALLACVSSCTSGDDGVSGQGDITFKLDGFRNEIGVARLGLFNDAAEYSSGQGKPFIGGGARIIAGKATIILKNIPYGTYAVGAIHDENNNGALDFLENGINAEGFGRPGGPIIGRKPEFSEAALTINRSVSEVSLTIQYHRP